MVVGQAPPVALRSVLEGEIRAFAAHQGVDGHRQCMRKFLELLLARGDLSVSFQSTTSWRFSWSELIF